MTTHYTDVAAVSSKLTNEAKKDLESIKLYRDAVNFLAASMIYLKDNYLVREPLKPEHVKERLLGHWGTCPGINIAYAHSNYLIKKHEDADMLFVLGPGHGAPAIIANLYASGELAHFYPQYGLDYQGVSNLIRGFSYPGGFPSHTNPYLPGTIHEGGELGYSLAVSYGAVMNKPNLIVTCLVGDGEAETGPTATAWHAHKFIDPKESGAVIPIVHINGYKISSATLYGTMDDENLIELFSGYGYQPRIVKNLENIDIDMSEAMEWAYQQIRAIQKAAREGKPITKPRWPVLLMITPKGWTGIKSLDGKKIEGNCLSHQVPAKDARTNPNSLKALEDWLKSYNVDNFFDEQGNLKKSVSDFFNFGKRGMGLNKNAFPDFTPLDLPSIKEFAVPVAEKERCCALKSATFECGKYLAEVIKRNPQTFKIFSPDELESNKFDYVFKVTGRNYQWLEATANKGGSVIEILSEHTCQAFLQGYLLTGRFGLFPSYEAFLGVIATMMVQYAKFLKIAAEVPFRGPVPSMNYVETSTLWRQEHNGFSHQNPGFINTLVNMKASQVRIYLPPDANCMISTMDHVLKSKNYVNLIISSKLDSPSFLSMEEAIDHCRAGASVWKFASTDNGVNPDVVLVAIGAEMTTEVIAASHLLKQYAPSLRIRVVNVTDMMILEPSSSHPHGLTEPLFNGLFTEDKPVIVNFHGYPSAVKQLLFGRKNLDRFTILGYIEEGTTTTPFKMLTSNKVSRYDVAIKALQVATAADSTSKTAIDAHTTISKFQHFLRVHDQYILKNGADPAEVENLNLFISNLKEKPISESQLP